MEIGVVWPSIMDLEETLNALDSTRERLYCWSLTFGLVLILVQNQQKLSRDKVVISFPLTWPCGRRLNLARLPALSLFATNIQTWD
jgi:hypothetical protein